MNNSINENEDVDFNLEDVETFDFVENPFDLHEKFKDFLKKNKNNSFEMEYGDESKGDLNNSGSSHANTSETESDLSFDNMDMPDMVQRYRAMKSSNKLLRDKNEDLSRQLETLEEDSDNNRKHTLELEKELKCHQETAKDRDCVLVEMGKLQEKLDKEKEHTLLLEEEGRRLRSSEEDTLTTIKSMRNQIDLLMDEVQLKNSIYEETQTDLFFWKNKYTNLQEEVELSKNEVFEKFKHFEQVKEKAEHYKNLFERQAEEKKMLMNQFQEMQLEVSIYNKATEDPGLVGNIHEQSCLNLHSELTQALQGNVLDIPGKRRSCSTDKIRGWEILENLEGSLNNSAVTSPRLVELSTQTELKVSNQSAQTTEEVVNISKFNETERKCEKLQDQLSSLNTENRNLSGDITLVQDRMKNMSNQLQNHEKKSLEILKKMREYEEEIICLNDINCKLCASKMSDWLKDTNFIPIQGTESKTTIIEKNDFRDTCKFNRYMDALSLEGLPIYRNKNANVSDKNIMHDFDIEEFLTKSSSYLLLEDEKSISQRIKTLSFCNNSMQSIFKQKIDNIKSSLCQAFCGLFYELNDVMLSPSKNKLSQDLTQQLLTLETIVLKISDCAFAFGIAQCEEKFFELIKAFKNHIENLEMLSYQAQFKKEIDVDNVISIRNIPIQDSVLNESMDNTDFEVYVDEISPEILEIVQNNLLQLKWIKMIQSILPKHFMEEIVGLGYSARNKVMSIGKIPILIMLFIICGYLSYKPVDYKVDPVF